MSRGTLEVGTDAGPSVATLATGRDCARPDSPVLPSPAADGGTVLHRRTFATAGSLSCSEVRRPCGAAHRSWPHARRRSSAAGRLPPVRRPGPDRLDGDRPQAAHGVEQLEQVRLQRQRDADQGGRRRDGLVRPEGRRLPVRRDRRLLAGVARRERDDRARPGALQGRDEGAGGLRPLEGPEVRRLLGRRRAHLRGAPGQQRLRGGGRPPVRGVGRGLPEVRLVQHRRRRSEDRLPDDEGRAEGDGAADPLQHVRVGAQPAVDLGARRRAHLAHDRRHLGSLGQLHAPARPAGRPGEVRGSRRLERPGHAGGRQRRHDATPSTARTSASGACSRRR